MRAEAMLTAMNCAAANDCATLRGKIRSSQIYNKAANPNAETPAINFQLMNSSAGSLDDDVDAPILRRRFAATVQVIIKTNAMATFMERSLPQIRPLPVTMGTELDE
jgi:hypothetical protein